MSVHRSSATARGAAGCAIPAHSPPHGLRRGSCGRHYSPRLATFRADDRDMFSAGLRGRMAGGARDGNALPCRPARRFCSSRISLTLRHDADNVALAPALAAWAAGPHAAGPTCSPSNGGGGGGQEEPLLGTGRRRRQDFRAARAEAASREARRGRRGAARDSAADAAGA